MNFIDIKNVEHIAGLARIKLGEKEKEKMAEELGAILGYIDKLKEVNTEGVEPTVSVAGMENVWRMDKPPTTLGSPKVVGEPNKKPLEDQAADAVKLVEMAPEKKDNFVKVPAVFGE